MSTSSEPLQDTKTATNTSDATPTVKRKNKVTPTPKQRKAARIMADVAMGLRPDIQNQADIVLESGYGKTIAAVPSKVLNTSGVIDALADIGFNEHTAKKVVESILTSEDSAAKDRLKAADMVFKVHGTYAAEKHVSINIDAQVDDARLLELANRLRNA